MSKHKKVKEEVEEVVYNKLSDQELAEFNLVMEKYRIHKTLSDGEKITYCKWENWLVDQGAMGSGKGMYQGQYYITNVTKYEELRNKIDQWLSWRGRREYGKKMGDQQLDKIGDQMADSMRVRSDVDN